MYDLDGMTKEQIDDLILEELRFINVDLRAIKNKVIKLGEEVEEVEDGENN